MRLLYNPRMRTAPSRHSNIRTLAQRLPAAIRRDLDLPKYAALDREDERALAESIWSARESAWSVILSERLASARAAELLGLAEMAGMLSPATAAHQDQDDAALREASGRLSAPQAKACRTALARVDALVRRLERHNVKLVLYVIGRTVMNPRLAPKLPPEETDVPFGQVLWHLLTSLVPLAVLILCVLGAILFGLATPSEAAAVGALGGLVLAAAYRALRWDRLKEAVFLTARTTAMVCFLFIGSWNFASVFSYLGGHHVIESWVLGMQLSPIGFLILAQLIIFLLGWPLEWTEIIIIFVPIFLPLLPAFDIDPIFFGVLVALNLQTAFLTPPMAMSAYYLKGIAPPNVQLMEIFRGCMPFLLLVFLSMVLVYVFQDLVYWLPNVIYGR